MLQLVAGVWIINKIGNNIMSRNLSKNQIEKAWELRKNGMLEVNKISGEVRLAETKKIIPLYRYFSETDEIREYRALLDEDIDNYLSGIPEIGQKVEDQDIDDQIPQDCKWKALTGFAEDYSKRYEVSDKHGLIMDTEKGKLLDPYINNHGRALVSLKGEDGSWKLQFVSRCVAMAWVDNPDPKHKTQVHHINGKVDVNDASNLMWVSPEEHYEIHRVEQSERLKKMWDDPEFRKKVIEALRIAVVMIDPDTDEIEQAFISVMEAERETGIDHSNIVKCLKGKRSLAGGHKWEYLESK